MDKRAQRRGKIEEFTENLNLPGKMFESFSPEFSELMDKLREVDIEIREIAMGGAGVTGSTLKDLLKVAQTNFNRREYMTSVAFLGRFHDRLEAIDAALSNLKNNVDMKHHEFLFGDMESDNLNYLTQDLSSKFEKYRNTPTGILTRASLEKESGVVDWWHNIQSDRGKTLAGWEKRFPKYSKDLKNQTNLMINRSESLLNFLLSALKIMSGLRNARKLEEYLKAAQKLQEKFKAYNVAFIQYYNSHVKHFIDYQKSVKSSDGVSGVLTQTSPNSGPATDPLGTDIILDKKPVSPNSGKITPDKDLPTYSQVPPTAIDSKPMEFPQPLQAPAEVVSSVPSFMESSPDAPTQNASPFEPLAPNAAIEVPKAKLQGISPLDLHIDETLVSPGVTPKKKKSSNHALFLYSLATLENEHPMVIAKEIITYANSIKTSDPETSERLLDVAQHVLKG